MVTYEARDRLWARHEVAEAEPRTLTYLHPRAGTLSFAVSELNLPDLPEARIVVYTPCDDDTRAKMPLTRRSPAMAPPLGRGSAEARPRLG